MRVNRGTKRIFRYGKKAHNLDLSSEKKRLLSQAFLKICKDWHTRQCFFCRVVLLFAVAGICHRAMGTAAAAAADPYYLDFTNQPDERHDNKDQHDADQYRRQIIRDPG